MASVSIYKGTNLLGTGTLTNNSASCTSYSGTAPSNNRIVQVTAGGQTMQTRVVSGSGDSTLVLYDKWPFAS